MVVVSVAVFVVVVVEVVVPVTGGCVVPFLHKPGLVFDLHLRGGSVVFLLRSAGKNLRGAVLSFCFVRQEKTFILFFLFNS